MRELNPSMLIPCLISAAQMSTIRLEKLRGPQGQTGLTLESMMGNIAKAALTRKSQHRQVQ